MTFSFSKKVYIAIIGDLKNSRQLQERRLIQYALGKVLIDVNAQYAEDIAAKFMITLGDEFQGLLNTGEHVLEIIDMIQRGIYPVKVRFGIGVGEMTTEIDPNMAIGADGPAYYMARNAIDYLKQEEQQRKKTVSEIRLQVDGDNSVICDLTNTIFMMIALIENKWSIRQREIIWSMEKYQDGQKRCAERLSIAQSSVYRGLENGNYYAYREAKETVQGILQEIRNGEKIR